jgi:hypothetical protein
VEAGDMGPADAAKIPSAGFHTCLAEAAKTGHTLPPLATLRSS